MKKLIVTALAVVACVQAALSQGTVNFANTGTFSQTADRLVYVGQVGNTVKLTGTNYAAALYWGRTADALNTFAIRAVGDETLARSVGLFRDLPDPTAGASGTWAGGTRIFLGALTGEQLFLQVRVWDITRTGSYAQAAAAGGGLGLYGQSEVFSYLVPAATDAPGNKINGLRAFSVVPEPSTIALGVLGLGSLLLFRRKKA
jgi:hypothetical protein